jgi:hypothetical protein
MGPIIDVEVVQMSRRQVKMIRANKILRFTKNLEPKHEFS